MKVLASCLLIATSLTLAMATHQLIGEPPLLMTPQHPNVYVYENNSMGERQNLVLPCSLMDTSNVMYQWFRGEGNQEFMVPAVMIDQVGTLTVYNITEGDYASREGVKYYCVASRNIGKGNYTASVRSRTITVFYAFFDGFSRMVEEEVSVSVAIYSDVALECDVLLSSPPPQIRWLRDGNPIAEVTINNEVRFLDGGRFLYLRILTVADLASTYRCEVTNVFLDRPVMAPTMYRLIDNLTRGDLMDYKQIGDLTAFVGNMSFEFAYVGGLYSNGPRNGTINNLFQGTTQVADIGNVASITTIDTAGTFQLSATVHFDGVTRDRTGTLTVHQLPSITRNPTSDRELVVGMENLKYTCEFRGSLMPDIEWYFSGQPIAADSGISINGNNLTIASPQVSNSGIYQCIVINDFGDDQAAWLLEIRPSILPEVTLYNFTELDVFNDRDLGALIVQEYATQVDFFVDIVADPCPNITWFFNGTQLGPSNDTFMYNNACAAMDARSPNWWFTLTVPSLTEDTSGSYTATFTNIAGTTELPTPAYFTIPAPVSVTGLTLSLPCLKEGQYVTLRCNITGFPRPEIQFYFNDVPITPGMGDFANFIEQRFYDEITILNVNITAQGRYACAVVNEGSQQQETSQDYDFCSVPNITSATATPNPVIGEPFSIDCTAAGTPQPQISWRKDGFPLEGTSDQVLRIVEISGGRTSSVVVSVSRQAFNGVYECIGMNAAGSMMKSFHIELQESNQISSVPLSLGAIIGIAAGGVGLILLIAFVVLRLYCLGRKTSANIKRMNSPSRSPLKEFSSADDHIKSTPLVIQIGSSGGTSIPDNLIISVTDIKLADSIGQGEFGIVYKGYIIKRSEQIIVAVKTLKGFYDHSAVEEILKECTKMKELNHPNVLKLIGVCLDGGPTPFIVTPFMGNGSLLSYLRKNRSTLLLTENEVKPVLNQLMGMCLQVAKGMEYLASMKIVHRDLAARNCMMDMNSVIKVGDFGLAETLGNKDYFRQDKSIIVKLPFRWLAPESLDDHVFSEKSDVWAYGVTCWEIFSGGKVPYPGIHVSELLWSLKSDQRLDKPENTACSDNMYSFMLQCWELEPKKRPPFSELVQSLSVTLETMADYVPLCRERESEV